MERVTSEMHAAEALVSVPGFALYEGIPPAAIGADRSRITFIAFGHLRFAFGKCHTISPL
jgi:hypothetical protein